MGNVQHQVRKFEMGHPGKSTDSDSDLMKPLPNINLKRNRTQLNIDRYFTTSIGKQDHISGARFKFRDSPVGSRIPSSNDTDLTRDIKYC